MKIVLFSCPSLTWSIWVIVAHCSVHCCKNRAKMRCFNLKMVDSNFNLIVALERSLCQHYCGSLTLSGLGNKSTCVSYILNGLPFAMTSFDMPEHPSHLIQGQEVRRIGREGRKMPSIKVQNGKESTHMKRRRERLFEALFFSPAGWSIQCEVFEAGDWLQVEFWKAEQLCCDCTVYRQRVTTAVQWLQSHNQFVWCEWQTT